MGLVRPSERDSVSSLGESLDFTITSIYHLNSIIDGLNNHLISNLAKINYQIRYYMVVITI